MALQKSEPIAIVGSGCRFPGDANSPSDLWKLLQSPRDVSKAISETDRFDPTGYYHPDGSHHATTNVQRAYLLEDHMMKEFDASFFNISPNEADSVDPQQRLLLEAVYEALESGGITVEELRGSDTAVFAGCMGVDWNDLLLRDTNTLPTYFATGTNRAIISNRVSYFFDWHGPSMTIDTACSSSLIAVHQSVQALRSGESRVAVACGTNVILGPDAFVFESKMKMLSPTGRSRMWDIDADGYARGDGVAAVVLKRLSDAIADGDHIECLVRETGANQDGHSSGITVPSTEAQAALIRKTYAKAGLDLQNDSRDRPQFFEAHGTGTKAGDPKEAAAIADCFGGGSDGPPLYVGSVKTVIGHTEGAAGLLGVLKGSCMIQNAVIAPNLLFNRLNPDIEKYYQGLTVPTNATAWPKLPEGVPRRVSVNSFGFGGSNAHAILEQYCETTADSSNPEGKLDRSPFAPFVFSAASEASLATILQKYSDFLKTKNDINVLDLSWTLRSRRSQLPVRTAFSALNIEQLTSKIDEKLDQVKQNAGTAIGIRSKATTTAPRILGIFTGQGAQWEAMGAELIRSSDFVRGRVQELEEALATLPQSDRPSWRLQDEMLARDGKSRIAEAELSQPLCTVIQIIIVDLLRAAGIIFQAVVGHSSGEIAAAYAANFLSAQDAVRIAYYRGLHSSRLSGNPDNAQKGAMLAVGTSWEDAQDLVSLRAFRGRVTVAAHNSPASVTLSGDADAIVHAKKVFDEEKKFARLLKVDTAYHSHHMLPCGDPYVQSLRECGVKVNRTRSSTCTWFSSVLDGKEMSTSEVESLTDVYWRDNMTNAVLFAEAVKSAAASDDQLSLAIEVGPHPALKGPTTQTLSDTRLAALPYTGVLIRGKSDVESLSDALGLIWAHFGAAGVDLEAFDKTISAGAPKPRLVVGLPSYQWHHGRTYWHESRRSKKIRGRKEPFHEILGVPCPDSTDHDRRWQNVLKPAEIPWLEGHQLQGQTVFPAAGYCAMAFEAAKSVAGGRTVELFELDDLAIPKAITFEEDVNFAVETLVSLTSITDNKSTVTAIFSCYSVPTSGTDLDMELMANGTIKIILGTPSHTTLPSTTGGEDYNMSPIDTDKFYSNLLQLGYGYTGGFRGMTAQKRKLNQASALVSTYAYTDADSSDYLVHPTMLDVTFQATMLAFSAPGDDRLWSLHVPTRIGKILINPELCTSLPISNTTNLPIHVELIDNNDANSICASIDVSSPDAKYKMIQVEDLTMKPFAPATEADDRRLFSLTKWNHAAPNGAAIADEVRPSAQEVELATLCERLSYAYLRSWKSDLTDEEWANSPSYFLYLQEFMNHTLSTVSRGEHPCVKKEWSDDTLDDVKALIDKLGYAESVDIKLLSAVSANIPAAIRGQTTILEHMVVDDMLDVFYKKGLGFERYNNFLADMAQQVTHRYPHARILEIGAGTGGATKTVFERIGSTMSSYTYTDISVGFFDKASELFREYSDKMIFKPFDVEKMPASQGFEQHSYDIVIASNVLHATASIHKTLEHTRQLIKPGGYLLMLELTNNGPIRRTNIMGGLPGWWIGEEDGRKGAPTITPGEWHTALRRAGFSGVDAITPDIDTLSWPFSIVASQAVDDRVSFLRRPLTVSPTASSISIHLPQVVILGTGTLETARISEEISELLARFCGQITILDGLPSENDSFSLGFNPMDTTFINLVDMDSPIFKGLTEERMAGLKRVFELAKHVLWITVGAQADEPYHMASITFSRVISHEARHISLNHMDVSDLGHNVSKNIAEHLLRQYALDEWEVEKSQLLWSKEPEVLLDRGQLKLPRVMPDVEMNERLNAFKRKITKSVSISNSTVSVFAASPTSLHVLERVLPVAPKNGHQSLCKVESSTLMSLSVAPDTILFLGIGKPLDHGKATDALVTLSTTNYNLIFPIASVTVPVELIRQVGNDGLLIAVAGELLAASLVSSLPSESRILVHCSGEHRFLAAALTRQAAARSIRVIFAYNSQRTDVQDSTWIKLDARAPRHIIRRALLPANPTHFLDLHPHSYEDQLGISIVQILPSVCKRLDPADLYRYESLIPPSYDHKVLSHRLEDATSRAKEVATSATIQGYDDLVLPLDQIYNHGLSLPKVTSVTSIVKWPLDGMVKVEVQPLNARSLFSHDKTYLLVGLSGQIGQSLCEWMTRNGAGCVILTSRRPAVDKRWLKSFEGTGAIVKVMSLDVTDYQSLERVVKGIRATCPPIAGVANGAMVLHDSLFSEMALEEMTEVLRPKIDGTRNLDTLFHDDDLDFFILFSSSAGVIGNSGQSNYAAANGYLNSLARQRRKRGLAASAFDIGRVAGLGYAEAAGQVVIEQLTRFGLLPISESEFHTMFAETIRTGHVHDVEHLKEEDEHAVVTTGIRQIRDDEEIQGPWFENPRFSHCIVEARSAEADSQTQDKRTSLPVSKQLTNAANMEEALEVLKGCFAAKLRVILQSADREIEPDAPLVELGVDSLVAVEVRSWFLKELKVDVPVLKVVGGSSVADLCQLALGKLPEELIASIGKAGSGDVQTPEKSPKSSKTSTTTIATVPVLSSSPSSIDTPSFPSSVRSSIPRHDSVSAGDSSETSLTRSPSSENLTEAGKQLGPRQKFVKSEQISFGQSRFWFLRLLLQDQTTFNVTFYYKVTGAMRIGDLERAIRTVTARHEALRTCFVADSDASEADTASQRVLESSPMRLEHKRISRVEDVAAEYDALKAHVFDIANGESMRIILLTLSPSSHYMLISYHHIMMDGVSLQVFMADLEKAYKGEPLALAAPPRQFPDFSRSQRTAFEKGEMNEELNFWRRLFPDEPPILPLLPMAQVTSRPPMQSFHVHQVESRVDSALAARVKSKARAERCTPFHFYLAAFKVMIFLFTDVQDLTIGIADANRNDPDVMGTIGFFLNLLTLRFRRKPNQRFAEAIVEARNTTYAALGNSRLPFDVLLKELNVPRSSSYSPFFQAFFDYRQGAQAKHPFGSALFEVEELHPGRTAYDITLDVTDSATDAVVIFRTQKSLYDMTAANLLLDTYLHLVDVLSKDVSLPLKTTPLFSEKQRLDSVNVGRGPNLSPDWPATLPHRIDQVAEQHRDEVAVMDDFGCTLTYAKMANRVEAIAEALQKDARAGVGSRVLVFQQATADWPCSMLAIMRIGAVYVPLDLRNPLPRLSAVAVDCQPTALLTDEAMLNDTRQLLADLPSTNVINVSKVRSKPSTHVSNVAEADSPAAILYTSGSTGSPKGIVVTHAGLRNEIHGYTKTWKLGAERVLQQSAFTFNHSSDQMYTGLVNGGMVYVVPLSKRGDPLEITKLVQQHAITYTKATPSEYSLWIQYGAENLRKASHWRFAFGGGEPLTNAVLSEFALLGLPQLCFFNSYGPTEISISSHKKEVAYNNIPPEGVSGRIPCGYSLPNYATYILDEHLKPLPTGMPGEVVIGGAGVSLGYLNNEELTEQLFVADPYVSADYIARGWTRMYRTGDIGHLQSDGAMVFHRRMAGDTQIKIRGLRIELSDIESNIVAAARGVLREAVVTTRQSSAGSDFLVAHVVFAPHGQHDVTDKGAFLEHLLSHLPVPQYMVPVMAVPLETLPLTNHSKVDRKAIGKMALPQRAHSRDSGKEDVELTETMVLLKRVWQDVLGNVTLGFDISPSTSFFLVGGNSLLVIRLQSRIRQVFDVTVPLLQLLGANKLGEMARKIEESVSVGVIDWETETALPSVPSLPGATGSDLQPRTSKKTVLVTGGTSYLAKYILPRLATHADIGTIHLVAVRDKYSDPVPRKLPITDSSDVRVVSHTGDFALPLLGLSEHEFASLACEVDLILHMGAVRSFWDNYHVLRPANVHPTRELVKLAASRKVPIHYISSVGVLPAGSHSDGNMVSYPPSSAAAYIPPVDGSNGYVASRWASERILEKAADEWGVSATVHRFVPGSRTAGEASPSDIEKEFIRYVDLSRSMPDFSGWSGQVDIVDASEAAGSICEAVDSSLGQGTGSSVDGKGMVRFLHHESPITVDVAELRAHLQQARGDQGLDKMNGLKWIGRIKALGFGYFFAGQDVSLQGGSSSARFESRR